ncbi:MAG: AMP-binding protein [Pseudomonadota bacterium]
MQTPPPHPDSQSDAERLLGIVRDLARKLRLNVQDAEHLGLGHLLERDFGVDSPARVELLVRIERELGAKLGEKTFVDAETPRDLLRQIVGTVSAETSAPAGAPVFAEVKAYHPPQAASTLIEILDWHVTRHAERMHLTLYDKEERTENIIYRMLQEQARALLAVGLHQHGLSSGDRVAIMLPTGRGFFAAFYGALYAGCVPVPLYPPARPLQIEDHMRRIAGIIANA